MVCGVFFTSFLIDDFLADTTASARQVLLSRYGVRAFMSSEVWGWACRMQGVCRARLLRRRRSGTSGWQRMGVREWPDRGRPCTGSPSVGTGWWGTMGHERSRRHTAEVLLGASTRGGGGAGRGVGWCIEDEVGGGRLRMSRPRGHPDSACPRPMRNRPDSEPTPLPTMSTAAPRDAYRTGSPCSTRCSSSSSEGNLAPSPDDVACRSGVSLRSVYRYFADAG